MRGTGFHPHSVSGKGKLLILKLQFLGWFVLCFFFSFIEKKYPNVAPGIRP